MSYLLFIDESGHDERKSPHAVLAGVAIKERALWKFICELQELEIKYFGERVSSGLLELKGKKLLKGKTFHFANQTAPLDPEKRTELARRCLQKGHNSRGSSATSSNPTRDELTALGQAKLGFVDALLELCIRYQIVAFASIVEIHAPKPEEETMLRKDYAYLFERFYYFLEAKKEHGLVVFDELERSMSHILVEQMAYYFKETAKGKQRATKIVPEPFFVHSHLTTFIQVADIVAYLLSWGYKMERMKNKERKRPELERFNPLLSKLRYSSKERGGYVVIDDLRTREQQRQDWIRAHSK